MAGTTTNDKPNDNAKAFGGIVAVMAVIAGIYSFWEPMNQRIDFICDEVQSLEERMIIDDAREREDQSALSTMSERFKEVETQFSNVEEKIAKMEKWLEWFQKEIPEHFSLDATQSEKISQLEREVHSHTSRPLPTTTPTFDDKD